MTANFLLIVNLRPSVQNFAPFVVKKDIHIKPRLEKNLICGLFRPSNPKQVTYSGLQRFSIVRSP